MKTCIYVYVYKYVYVCIYVYVCVCVCIYIHIYVELCFLSGKKITEAWHTSRGLYQATYTNFRTVK